MKKKIKGSSYLIGKDEDDLTDEECDDILKYVQSGDYAEDNTICFYKAHPEYNTVKKRDELINVLMKYSNQFDAIVHDYMEVYPQEDLCSVGRIAIKKLCNLKHPIYFRDSSSSSSFFAHVDDVKTLDELFGILD